MVANGNYRTRVGHYMATIWSILRRCGVGFAAIFMCGFYDGSRGYNMSGFGDV